MRYLYTILFSPRKLAICDLIFEEEGIYEYLILAELENDLNQIDNNILSMEMNDFFSNYFIYGDQCWFKSIAKSLINIQLWFGKIPNVHLHGNCANGVYDLMKRLDSLTSSSTTKTKNGSLQDKYDNNYKIGHLILVDRNIDFVTPFCSSLVYEGLLDDAFHINAGFIDVPQKQENDDTNTNNNKTKRIRLCSNDKVFDEIRNIHIVEVFSHLKSIVTNMKNIEGKRNELVNLSDVKRFVSSDLKDYTKYRELLNLRNY
jgi:vacuolar protein sorting-associated protein 33B